MSKTIYILLSCLIKYQNLRFLILIEQEKRLHTHPAIIIHPSWSTMRTSSDDGGLQNRCCRICRMDSTVFGVSFSPTARWPRVRIVLVEIRVDSLKKHHTQITYSALLKVTIPHTLPSFTPFNITQSYLAQNILMIK